MKRALFAAALVLAGSACGGGGDDGISFEDPDKAQFTYGTPVAAGDAEAYAVAAAEASVVNALYLAEDTDRAAAYEDSDVLAGAPSEIADIFDAAPPALRAAGAASVRALLQGGAGLAEEPAFDDPGCWELTAGELRFDHCTVTDSGDGGTLRSSIDGSLHREAGRVYWDVTVSMRISGVDGGVSVSMSSSDRRTGDIVYTGTTYAGFARADLEESWSAGGVRVSGAVTYNVDYDLTFQPQPDFCVTGGTVTAKRIWAKRPAASGDVDPADLTDASAQLTWTGCGAVNVAWGTAL